ncbi:hypothetical protein CAPTEDRAFT_209186 [Capitella teleta]|uniref:Mab-21-like nucleotidyltransferase domain-containing protein n=1 Tax=Capitella teleta TaxID=283909 RepID=R7VLX1_CAPTE|nr:hypothetical protein CAPTEDRAFT_209186 [Capitella teleta]|eukprot:ELU18631.1 hypothetical protein CAPTEDRAFT_209186 [Capitella teleta]
MGSLDARLNSYYEDCVAVESREMERMTDIYQDLKSKVREFLHNHLPFDIGDPIDRGSSHEGLKIRHADEFDVLIPLKISGSHWSFETYAVDYCFVKIFERVHDYSIPSNLRQDGYLSAAQVRASFQSAVQRFVNQYVGNYTLKLSTHGPAFTLDVCDRLTKLFSVDLVPLVKLGNTWLVAKPHPDSVGIRNHAEGVLWRRSFTHQESHYIRNISHESKKVLKIVKAMRLDNQYQMGMLPSYVYKLAFLHWYHKEKSSSSISANVVSFLSYLSQVLFEKKLHPYPDSEHNVNILKSFTSNYLLNLAHFIRTIARSETELMAALGFWSDSHQTANLTHRQIPSTVRMPTNCEWDSPRPTHNDALCGFGQKTHIVTELGANIQAQASRLKDLVVFITLVYSSWWLSCTKAVDAPYNDLKLWKRLSRYKLANKTIADSAMYAFGRHFRYLTDEMVPLALFSNRVPYEERQLLGSRLLSIEPENPTMPSSRGVKLSSDFLSAARNEENYQIVIQVVQQNREDLPNLRQAKRVPEDD